MKACFRFRCCALVVLECLLAAGSLPAQNFSLSVSNPAGPVSVASPITYFITVTNLTGASITTSITNRIVGPAQITAAGLTLGSGGVVSSNATTAVFTANLIFGSPLAQFSLTVQPTTAGFVSNNVSASALIGGTNVETHFVSVVTSITNGTAPPPAGGADLAVGITVRGPVPPVIVNDFVTVRMAVTNLSPDSASGVSLTSGILTNPAAQTFVLLRGVTPTNILSTITNDALSLHIGTLNSGAVTNISVVLQPTNAGPLTFLAFVDSDTTDPDATNNTATAAVFVTNYFSGQLQATNVSSMVYNPQTGFMEQTVRLTNIGSNNLVSARLVVSNLTAWLFNAAGTNAGSINSFEPFVYLANALDTNQSVDLVLELFVPTRVPITAADYLAFEVPPVNLTIPAGAGTPFEITTHTNLPSGDTLVEFESVLGRSYTVVYSDNAQFTNAAVALPPIIAPADRVQWIDAGPPKTMSNPTNGARFYRVLLER